ncbi:MAG: hypothetical protein IIY49_06100 [Eubacterium sp.]|nr:hypothetical protein [Eubacterium sp.]
MPREMRVDKTDFPMIVEIYNSEGNSAAQKYIRETYGMVNSGYVIKRIKKSDDYHYDEATDRFVSDKNDNKETKLFMNLDELCDIKTSKTIQAEINVKSKKDAMESLIKELISDRLLELSRYIMIDTSSRTIMIDVTTMKTDGYQVVTH